MRFILIVVLSVKIIPSKKKIVSLQKLLDDYKSILELENDLKIKATVLALECPACKENGNYWTYLEEEKCKKCGSTLWSTNLKEKDQSYLKLLEKKEKVRRFYAKLTNRMLRKLKRDALFEKK